MNVANQTQSGHIYQSVSVQTLSNTGFEAGKDSKYLPIRGLEMPSVWPVEYSHSYGSVGGKEKLENHSFLIFTQFQCC